MIEQALDLGVKLLAAQQQNRELRELIGDILTVIAEDPSCDAGDLQYRIDTLIDSKAERLNL